MNGNGTKVRKDHLTVNPYSRPQRKLVEVRAVVMHWVANPGTSAQANRDFFESRKDGRNGYGSAHFVVDANEIVECIPVEEMAYHVGASSYTRFSDECLGAYPNATTIGVEMCHPRWDGSYEQATWQRAVDLVADLLRKADLPPSRITTHHAVTGKECPKWFVDNPSELERFRWDVEEAM